MIKSESHARAVQFRRYKAGLKGTSKAVRRFYVRICDPLLILDLKADFTGCRSHNECHAVRT